MGRLSLQQSERAYQAVLRETRTEREKALAERCAAVAEAHDIDGMTYEEIGEAIGIHNSLAVRLAAKHRKS